MTSVPGVGSLFDSAAWTVDAVCGQTDPEAFFPEKGNSVREAKALCRRCVVRAECLETALANNERFGIWGGLSEVERRRFRRLHIIEIQGQKGTAA
ncbi:WhiB family transcriptional regulator [Actinopolymorpha sp. B17G11]|uniref:WhiB family transcriptional regulator n=1 Tax=Actinopolymorpha sp. B17G11 TaxID=3160861 RepID=UPI0032E37DA5